MVVSCIYSIRSNSYLEMLFQLQYNGIRILKKKTDYKDRFCWSQVFLWEKRKALHVDTKIASLDSLATRQLTSCSLQNQFPVATWDLIKFYNSTYNSVQLLVLFKKHLTFLLLESVNTINKIPHCSSPGQTAVNTTRQPDTGQITNWWVTSSPSHPVFTKLINTALPVHHIYKPLVFWSLIFIRFCW